MLACCEEVRELARGELEPLSIAVGDRFSALALHELGQHDAAERLAYRVMQLDADALEFRFQSAIPFHLSMRIRLARIHWLRGEFRLAWAMTQEVIVRDEDAHIYAKCHPLAFAAVPIAVWKGDVPAATRWNQELLDHATRGNVPYWQSFAKVFARLLDGQPVLPESQEARMLAKNVALRDLCASLQLVAPDPITLARVRSGAVGWNAPEVLRLAALAAFDPQDEASRAACLVALREAFALSVEQGARFWSLRCAISLFEVAASGSADRESARSAVLSLLNAIDDGSTQPDLCHARRVVAEAELRRA